MNTREAIIEQVAQILTNAAQHGHDIAPNTAFPNWQEIGLEVRTAVEMLLDHTDAIAAKAARAAAANVAASIRANLWHGLND